jgi:MFS family permease
MSDQNQKTPKKNASFTEQVNRFSPNFWICNLIEAFERLAFFGVTAIRSLYMKNALKISDSARGDILGTWALIQCLVPMVSGGYTDSYGYRRSMYVAFTINILGYIMMAFASGTGSMFAAACLVGLGTAIFKPPVQGSVAKSLDQQNSGVGFGVFYWLVNVGGFFAPMAAASLRGNAQNPTWSYVFFGAAITTAVNFLPATFLFKEPEIAQADKNRSPLSVFAGTITVLLRDKRMLFFLMIISGFWFMFMQLWDLLPIHIDEWVDTRDVGGFIQGFGGSWQSTGLANYDLWLISGVLGLGAAAFALLKRQRLVVGLFVMVALMFLVVGSGWKGYLNTAGGAKPEILINIDAFAIVLLVIPISWFFGRYPMIVALLSGMVIGTIGFIGAGTFANRQYGLADDLRVRGGRDDLQPQVQRIHRHDRAGRQKSPLYGLFEHSFCRGLGRRQLSFRSPLRRDGLARNVRQALFERAAARQRRRDEGVRVG